MLYLSMITLNISVPAIHANELADRASPICSVVMSIRSHRSGMVGPTIDHVIPYKYMSCSLFTNKTVHIDQSSQFSLVYFLKTSSKPI